MSLSKHRKSRKGAGPARLPQVPLDPADVRLSPSLPSVIASAFTRLRLALRVRVLRRLLMPVGPMALAVLAGGAFAKFAAQARWPRMSVSLEDAAGVTSSQVYELVRYVEQSNPMVLQQVLVAFARDGTTMAAVGASLAAIVMQHLAKRTDTRTARTGSHPPAGPSGTTD